VTYLPIEADAAFNTRVVTYLAPDVTLSLLCARVQIAWIESVPRPECVVVRRCQRFCNVGAKVSIMIVERLIRAPVDPA
jgi:hypothetical protein